MIAFGDASALVKLYADEAGAEQVRGLTGLVVGQISRVEVPAALWRKQRLGEITSAEAQVLVEEFEADFFGTPDEPPRFAVVTLSANVLDGAAQLNCVPCMGCAATTPFSSPALSPYVASTRLARRWQHSIECCGLPRRWRALPCCQPAESTTTRWAGGGLTRR